MEFVKNNIVLLIIFLVTLLISVYMVIQCRKLSIEILNQIVRRDENVKKIAAAYEKRNPNVNERNEKRIFDDFVKLNKKKFEIQNRFGKFYRKAFRTFAGAIEDSRSKFVVKKVRKDAQVPVDSEEKLLQAFADYYNKCSQEQKPVISSSKKDEDVVHDFFRSYFIYMNGEPPEKESPEAKDPGVVERKAVYEAALKKFAADVNKVAIDFVDPKTIEVNFAKDNKTGAETERIESHGVYQYLLDAMGVPRTASISIYKNLLSTVNGNFVAKHLVPGVNGITVTQYTFPSDLGFEQSLIPAYILQLQIRQDLFTRLKKAGVEEMKLFKAESALQGESLGGKYKKHVYRITFVGTMKTVQKVLKQLGTEAVDDNIVYIVNELSITRTDAEDVKKLIRAEGGSESKYARRPSVNPSQPGQPGQSENKEAPVVFGQSKTVTVTMLFSCIIYVGSELQRNQDAK